MVDLPTLQTRKQIIENAFCKAFNGNVFKGSTTKPETLKFLSTQDVQDQIALVAWGWGPSRELSNDMFEAGLANEDTLDMIPQKFRDTVQELVKTRKKIDRFRQEIAELRRKNVAADAKVLEGKESYLATELNKDYDPRGGAGFAHSTISAIMREFFSNAAAKKIEQKQMRDFSPEDFQGDVEDVISTPLLAAATVAGLEVNAQDYLDLLNFQRSGRAPRGQQ